MAVTALSGQRWQGASNADGTITPTTDGSDTILKFTESGTFTPAGSFNVEYLVVGGGGGGATTAGAHDAHSSGGGGAGGYLANGTQDHAVTAQTYTITVGSGGAGSTTATNGTNGDNSIFDTETAIGGGGGGNSTGSSGSVGSVGGSGGGGSAYSNSAGGAGTTDQGYAGGAGIQSPNYGGGGGGGSASVGADADTSTGGNGGTGTSNDITGSSLYYGGGGGGGGSNPHAGGTGGSSIGGDGWTASASPTSGVVNTGSGGGGTPTGDAGSGSSGIVIIRFTTSGNSYTATMGTQDDKTTVTDVPVGSQFEQTDNYKSYQASNSSTDSDGYGTVATDNSGETKNLVFDAGGAVVGDFTFRGTYTAVGGSTAWHGDASIWVADKDVAYKTSGSDDGVTGLCAVWKHESTGYDMWSRFTDFTDRTEIHRCVESGNPYTDCAGIFGNEGAGASFGTNINVEMARTGTTLTMKLYNSDWSSVTDTATRTSVISTKLRYFSFGGQHDGSITFTNSYSAITFDGVKWVERGTAI